MAHFAKECAQAAAELRTATARLKKARQRYEAGVTRGYEALAQRRAALQEHISTTERSMKDSRDQLERELARNRQRMTRSLTHELAFLTSDVAQVQSMQQRQADMARELQAQEPAARELHREYRASYEAAYTALARHRAWQALASHGPAIAQAVAMLVTVPLASDALLAAGGGTQAARAAFVWSALQRLALDMDAGPTAPDVQHQLGPYEPCTFDPPTFALMADRLARERDAMG